MRAPLDLLVVVKDTLRVKLARTSWLGRVGAVVVVVCLAVGGALVALNGSGEERAGQTLQPGPGPGAPGGEGDGDAGGSDPAGDAATALNLGVGREGAADGEVAAPGATGADDDAGRGAPVDAPGGEAGAPVDGPGGPPAGTGHDGASPGAAEAPAPDGGSPAAPTSSTSTPPATSPSASTTTTTTASTTTTAPRDGGGGGLVGGVLDLLLGHG